MTNDFEKSDVEDRLREALRARAEDVTHGDLTRSFDEISSMRPTSAGSRGAWVGAAAAAVVVAAAATGIAVVARHDDGGIAGPVATQTVTAAPAPTGSPTPLVQSTIQPLPNASAGTGGLTTSPPFAAREEPRSTIPWAQVGPGWTAATWSPTRPAGSGAPTPATLFLVSPSGARYAVGQVDTWTTVEDVSPDGRRILVSSSTFITEWDVARGAVSHRFSVAPRLVVSAKYTRPTGQAVLVSSNDAASFNQPLERRTLDGVVQQVYPGFLDAPIISADGLTLVSGLNVFDNAGHVVRTLSAPAGYKNCQSLRWWQPGQLLVSCSHGPSLSNLWLYPTSGAVATQLTQAAADRPADNRAGPFGFVDAWRMSSGILVQAGSGCGNGPVGILAPDGLMDPFTLARPQTEPGSDPGLYITAVVGNTAYLSVYSCSGPRSVPLVISDLGTKVYHALLGPGANDGSALAWVTLGAPE